MTDKISNARLAEMGVDAIARLARMKGPLADVSAISAWMHDARNALRNAQSEAVAYWAVHSLTGSHIGLWKDEAYARNVLKEYAGGTITPLHTHPAPRSEAVAVKPLEWKMENETTKAAETILGWYHLDRRWDGLSDPIWHWKRSGGKLIPCATLEAAKAAAQADYEQRIRSALTHPAPPLAVTEEMVDGGKLLSAINKLPRQVMEVHDNNGDVFVSLRKVRAALTAALEAKQ